MRFVILALTLIGCGGGGGGGSSGSGLDRLPSTGVRVIHTDIDASPVRLVAGGQSSGDVRFGERGAYVSIAGEVLASLVTSNTENVSASTSVTSNQRKSVLFADGVTVLDDFTDLIPAGFARVRVVHGVKDVGNVSALVSGKTDSASYRGATEYFEVPAGKVDYLVTTTSGARVAGGSFEAQSQKPYTILVSGDSGYFVIKNVFLG